MGATALHRMPRGHILLLAAIAFFVPSILVTEMNEFTDSSYTAVLLTAPLWTFSHSYGTDYGGPFDRTTISLLDENQLVTLGMLVMSLFLFLRVKRFAIEGGPRTLLTDVVVTAFAILVVCLGFFSYSLDAFAIHNVIPLPLMPVLGSIMVYYTYKRRE